MSPVNITKASGDQSPYQREKLVRSMMKSGASEQLASEVAGEVEKSLYPGIPSKEIYKLAFSILRRREKGTAGRYKLKRGIMELGPTGFPFEIYIAAILASEGFHVKTGQIVAGKCVKHEIDVVAERNELHYMVECKFHNKPGYMCDVKVPLYIQARFKDVEAQWKSLPGHEDKFHQGWVVTNTRFTDDALQYGICCGLYLLGWNYPAKDALKDKIDKSGLYPVTCLTTITRSEKQSLLDKGIVLCRQLMSDPDLLLIAAISGPRAIKVLDEVRQLCRN